MLLTKRRTVRTHISCPLPARTRDFRDVLIILLSDGSSALEYCAQSPRGQTLPSTEIMLLTSYENLFGQGVSWSGLSDAEGEAATPLGHSDFEKEDIGEQDTLKEKEGGRTCHQSSSTDIDRPNPTPTPTLTAGAIAISPLTSPPRSSPSRASSSDPSLLHALDRVEKA
ncbi:hypothetical protein BT96DRAFT_923035 [Gymnopus androsaceus JB14]|uniref:Uncharacterized protein n=1 Tax=Gymnopus androsaceus JB14 TaxID=1447944 RepID=A0A6A4H9Z4_9AGAR|nr:hypothetical protein BT96DRAFT_923035 [Gymnopus androsaceus JB14]